MLAAAAGDGSGEPKDGVAGRRSHECERLRSGSGFANVARVMIPSLAQPQSEQDAFERTKTSEGRLEKIGTDKSREKQPALVQPVSEGEAGEHERAGDEIDYTLDFHDEDG